MRITIIGSGYVGLVSGTCFAEMGNRVTCVDIDPVKIEKLNQGILPIFEPGLETMVLKNVKNENLFFTTALDKALQNTDIAFIAVGTPMGEDGAADLQYVLAVAKSIGQAMQQRMIVVNKSTVPVGTADQVKEIIQQELEARNSDVQFAMVSNPEFLKEGAAIDDFMKPDRVVIGADSEIAIQKMKELYAPFFRAHDRFITMDIRSAEMTKYAANAMLATKISFMNEIANICERVGADANQVRIGIGSDQRIGYSFIYPGVGYGGSCFPKDVKALTQMGKENNYRAQLIKELLSREAQIKAYDPKAMDQAKAHYLKGVQNITYAASKYAVLKDADALLLLTEWKEFRSPDFEEMKTQMKTPMIFDGRNQYIAYDMMNKGFEYYRIGK